MRVYSLICLLAARLYILKISLVGSPGPTTPALVPDEWAKGTKFLDLLKPEGPLDACSVRWGELQKSSESSRSLMGILCGNWRPLGALPFFLNHIGYNTDLRLLILSEIELMKQKTWRLSSQRLCTKTTQGGGNQKIKIRGHSTKWLI